MIYKALDYDIVYSLNKTYLLFMLLDKYLILMVVSCMMLVLILTTLQNSINNYPQFKYAYYLSKRACSLIQCVLIKSINATKPEQIISSSFLNSNSNFSNLKSDNIIII